MPGKSNARQVRLLQQPLTLPCGAVLPNRLAKAAMTEGLATGRGVPGEQLERLYGLWSDGGAGLLLCGNIQVDADHLERPGNVVIDQVPDRAMQRALSSLAAAGTRAGNHFWAQVSHAGRQTMKSVNPHPKAPSAVKLGLPGGQFGEPVALTEGEIAEIVRRFAQCAAAVQAAGFTGVQVHAAHGYLLSQFLSPRSNQRSDRYGGDLSNRARILLEVVAAVRTAVGPDFPVAVKLNKERVSIPLMVTGGFRRREAMEQAIASGGADLIGIGRPMCVMTDAPARLLSGEIQLPRYENSLSLFPRWLAFLNGSQLLRTLAAFSLQYWYYAQIEELGMNGSAAPAMSVFAASRKVLSRQKALLAEKDA